MMRLSLLHSWWFGICSFLVVFVLDTEIDNLTHSIMGDVLGIVFLSLYGVYCLQNFLACREIHCAFTGPGFLLAAGLLVLRAIGLVLWQVGVPYLVAFVAAAVGCCLEWAYAQRTGSHFLMRP
jgi:hypothetical protein